MIRRKTGIAILVSALAVSGAFFIFPAPIRAQPVQQASKEVDIIGREEKRRAELKLMAYPRKPVSIKKSAVDVNAGVKPEASNVVKKAPSLEK